MNGERITVDFESRVEAQMFADRVKKLRDEFVDVHACGKVGPVYVVSVDEALLDE